MNKQSIQVMGREVVLLTKGQENYISITDIAKYKELEHSDQIIQNWMRSRSTIEFIGLWENIHNPHFKPLEFEGFKNQAGANSFFLTPQRWIERTNAIGIYSKSGRRKLGQIRGTRTQFVNSVRVPRTPRVNSVRVSGILRMQND